MRAVLQAFAGYISTHILTRRMTTDGISATFPGIISTHILTRRMTWLRRMPLAALRYFNSHPHKEDDRNGKKVAISKKYFNSHPHKEDDLFALLYSFSLSHFNSHPHKEDDKSLDFINHTFNISTHILTRRMTCGMFYCNCMWNISTHILTRRMTTPATNYTNWASAFQLTSSQGG